MQDDELVARHGFVNEVQKQEQPLTQSEAESEFDALIKTRRGTSGRWNCSQCEAHVSGFPPMFAGSNLAHRRARTHGLSIGRRTQAWRTHSGTAVSALLLSEIRLVAKVATTRGPSSDHHRDTADVVTIGKSPPALVGAC